MSRITSSLDITHLFYTHTGNLKAIPLCVYLSFLLIHRERLQCKSWSLYSPYIFRMSSPTHSTTSHETLVPGLNKLLHSLHLTVHCLTEPWLSPEHTTVWKPYKVVISSPLPSSTGSSATFSPKSLVPLIGSNSTTSNMRHMTSGCVTLLFSGCFNIMPIT